MVQVDSGELGVATGAAGTTGVRRDRATEPGPVDAFSRGYDGAAYAVSGNIRRTDGKVVDSLAGSDDGVDEEHVAGRSRYEHLARLGDRVGKGFEL